jgi:hypothetical protein
MADLLHFQIRALVGLRPAVFVPRTPGRTWGTRPVSGRSVGTEKETAGPSASLPRQAGAGGMTKWRVGFESGSVVTVADLDGKGRYLSCGISACFSFSGLHAAARRLRSLTRGAAQSALRANSVVDAASAADPPRK